jgi:hypothetical protein
MNIIEYYNITDAYDDDRLPEPLKLKYSTKEKAIEVVVNNYKPNFDITNPRFDLDHIYKYIGFDGVHQNYNSSLYKFSAGCYDNRTGYYEIFFGETQHKIKEGSDCVIEFFAELFILFTEAKRVYVPEVKVAGQPYQPAKNEIEKIKEIGPFPLYQCKKYGDHKYHYGLEESMDNWYKTSRATIQENIYVCYNKLEIH